MAAGAALLLAGPCVLWPAQRALASFWHARASGVPGVFGPPDAAHLPSWVVALLEPGWVYLGLPVAGLATVAFGWVTVGVGLRGWRGGVRAAASYLLIGILSVMADAVAGGGARARRPRAWRSRLWRGRCGQR